jgi:hypothetical protein
VLEGDRITGTGRTVGTAAYLSPEQARGEPLNGQSDVYSLGLVLLECLTGEVEFPGCPIESAVVRLQRDPCTPAHLGSGWSELLGAMTRRESSARPSAQEVAFALNALADHATEPLAGVHSADLRTGGMTEQTTATFHLPALSRGEVTAGAETVGTGGAKAVDTQTAVPGGRRRGTLRSRRVRLVLVLAAALMGGAGIAASGGGPPAQPVIPVPSPSLAEPLEQQMANLERSLTP